MTTPTNAHKPWTDKGGHVNDDREALISPQQLQCDLVFWIEGCYIRERRHSTIWYLSQIDYAQAFITARTPNSVNP